MVGLVGAMKTVFLTTNVIAAEHYNESYVAIAALTGVPLMLSSITGLASCVVARIFGRRPVYLLATAMLFVGSIWNTTAADSYGSCMGARVVQGLGWGVFDTLVMTSIQDTYFVSPITATTHLIRNSTNTTQEHQRNLRVTLYNVLNIATTWGSPLIGGAISASHRANVTFQFRIISGLFLLAIPLMCLAAPETAFDRSRAAAAPTPVSGFTLSRRWQPWRVKHRLTRSRILGYLHDMRPLTFQGPVTKTILLQVPRALAAPTTVLVFLLSFLPASTLWGFSASLSLLLEPKPVSASPSTLGSIMTGPWILPTFVVGSLALYRGVHLQFGQLANCLVVCGGSSLALIGIFSFGLGINNFMSTTVHHDTSSTFSSLFSADGASQLSFALISFQLAILAAGSAVLDAATRPSLARSASFTSSNMTIALRSIGDMHTGVIVLRNLAAGIFAIAIPVAVANPGGLKAAALGLGVTQIIISAGIVALRCCFDESIWRADGKVMGLVDLSSLKLSVSFFDTD